MRILVLASLVLVGCSSISSLLTASPSSPKPPEVGGLEDCATGDVAANTALISDLRESYHEMIVCGGLALSFDVAAVEVIANAGKPRGGPGQLAYKGDGTYATANGMMELRVSRADGSPITFDILDPRSYFGGLSVHDLKKTVDAARRRDVMGVVSQVAGQFAVEFSSKGPGFSLLGLSSSQAAAGHLDNLDQLADALANGLNVATRIDVTNTQGGTTVHYILESPSQPLRSLIGPQSVPMKLASIEATHRSTGQTIRLTTWSVSYSGAHSALDGTIGLDVVGGAFPYHADFTYGTGAEPDVELSCR